MGVLLHPLFRRPVTSCKAPKMKNTPPLLLAACSVALIGCSKPDDVSTGAIYYNLSPELQTETERYVDAEGNMNVTSDVNSREFWGDLGRVLYTDQPSRLTPYPTTGTGVPR